MSTRRKNTRYSESAVGGTYDIGDVVLGVTSRDLHDEGDRDGRGVQQRGLNHDPVDISQADPYAPTRRLAEKPRGLPVDAPDAVRDETLYAS